MKMLVNDFYSVITKQLVDDGFVVVLKLNVNHQIFQSHFPGRPITPGVCILQIGKELLSEHYNMPLVMTEAKNIKFLQVIDPTVNNTVIFKISSRIDENGFIKASINIDGELATFTKINSTYKQVKK